jgi:chromosome segregation ATPase
MTKSKATYLLRVFGAVFFTVCLAQLAAGQNNKQPDDKEVLRALLTEVTLLRQALQTLQGLSLDTYRSQLMVDRIRVSQEDVRHLTTSLNETRDTLAKIQTTIPRNLDDQKMLEGQIQTEVEANKRAILELELKRSREAVESYKSQAERLREREQELSSALRTAQTKLDDLENRLNLLERAMDNDREKLERDKPAVVKTP